MESDKKQQEIFASKCKLYEMLRSESARRWIWIVSIAIVALSVYFFILCKCFEHSIFTSDSAGLLLEAKDILHGNFFLDGWHLTGVLFLTTDLFVHGLGVIFAGATAKGAELAGVFATFFLVATCLLFAFKKKDSFLKIAFVSLVFAGFCAFPCEFLMDAIRYHSAGIAEALLGYYILRLALDSNGKKRIICLILSILLMSTAAMSDSDTTIAVILPVAIVSLWNLIHKFFRKDAAERGGTGRNILLFSASMVSIGLGVLLDKLYFAISTANKNAYMNHKVFVGVDDLIDKFNLFADALLRMFNADFQHQTLLGGHTFLYFVMVAFILLGVFFILTNIVRWLSSRECDEVSVVLSLGIILTSIIFIVSNVSSNIWSARYIAFFPAFFCVIVTRGFRQSNFELKKGVGAIIMQCLCLVLCLVLAVFGVKSGMTEKMDHWRTELGWAKELKQALEDNKLESGYADFWYASSTTLLAGEKICVRSIRESNNKLERYNWFSKDEWYEQPAYFIVVQKKGVTADRVVAQCGTPSKVIKVNEELDIFAYDKDISSYFCFGLDDGAINAWEWRTNDKCQMNDGSIRIMPDGRVWGPYFKLNAGAHTAILKGDGVSLLNADVYSYSLDKFFREYGCLDDGNSVNFVLPQDIEDFELRLYNKSDKDVILLEAEIK